MGSYQRLSLLQMTFILIYAGRYTHPFSKCSRARAAQPVLTRVQAMISDKPYSANRLSRVAAVNPISVACAINSLSNGSQHQPVAPRDCASG